MSKAKKGLKGEINCRMITFRKQSNDIFSIGLFEFFVFIHFELTLLG